jgi:hypothetical protein
VHAGPKPQLQEPFEQLSAPDPQLEQAPPPEPQRLNDWPPNATQALPLQQPDGQEVASHTQLPATQRWPAAHADPRPQRQAPLEHPSASAPQSTQALPLEPQVVMD